MGQAKKRGTLQKRIEQAKARTIGDSHSDDRTHLIINNTHGGPILLRSYSCYDCGASMALHVPDKLFYFEPVHHTVQTGLCDHCGAGHLIASADSEADCIALEPTAMEAYKAMAKA